ncbi:MAG: hypothetical protein Q8P67_18370 [archaeon]|nr:hypothetical protein [archaeon]
MLRHGSEDERVPILTRWQTAVNVNGPSDGEEEMSPAPRDSAREDGLEDEEESGNRWMSRKRNSQLQVEGGIYQVDENGEEEEEEEEEDLDREYEDDAEVGGGRVWCRCRFFSRQNRNARGRQALRVQLLCLAIMPLRLTGFLMGWVSASFHVADLALLALGFVGSWLQERGLLLAFAGLSTAFVAAGALQAASWGLLLARHSLPFAYGHSVPRPWALAIVVLECVSLAATFAAVSLALRFRHLLGESALLRTHRARRRMLASSGALRGPPAPLPAPPALQEQLVRQHRSPEAWRSFIFDPTTADRPPPDCFIVDASFSPPPPPPLLPPNSLTSDPALEW